MNINNSINYVEFPARDIKATKAFFESAFGWSFEDFGPEYASFLNQGIDGGFFTSNLTSTTGNGAALLVLYSDALKETRERVVSAGGKIAKEIFPFPGGRRFHFVEPSGNELAVWSEGGA